MKEIKEIESLAFEYLEAKNAPDWAVKKSCETFTKLANTPKFPLYQIAFIRMIETCEPTSEMTTSIEERESSVEPWFEEKFYLATEGYAKKSENKELQSRALLAQLPYKKKKKEKEELLLEAMKLTAAPGVAVEKLKKLSPRFIENPPPSLYFEVGKDYEQVRDFAQARKYYELILLTQSRSLEEKLKAKRAICSSLKLERKKEESSKCLEEVAAFAESETKLAMTSQNTPITSNDQRIQSKIDQARDLWTNNKADKAMLLFNKLLQEKAAEKDKAQIYLSQGRIEMERENFEKASELFALGAELSTDNKQKVDLLWHQGLSGYFAQKYDVSEAAFSSALEQSESHYEQLKLQYWLGRTLQRANKSEEATPHFKEVFEKDPFHYYGIISARELKEKFQPLRNEQLQFKQSPWPVFDWLVSLNEKEFAQNYLKRTVSKKSENEIAASLIFFNSAEDYDEAINRFNTLSPTTKVNYLLQKNSHVVFPLPYQETVLKYTKANALSSEFVYSLIRQESAFDSHSRSPADAFGIMQLTPEKAKELGAALKSPEDLYDLDLNISLGTKLLAEDLKKYNYSFIQTISSYNAGPSAIAYWMRTRYKEDPIEFIEVIPYEETRTYLKTILRNYIIYKQQKSDEPFFFPEKIWLNINQLD